MFCQVAFPSIWFIKLFPESVLQMWCTNCGFEMAADAISMTNWNYFETVGLQWDKCKEAWQHQRSRGIAHQSPVFVRHGIHLHSAGDWFLASNCTLKPWTLNQLCLCLTYLCQFTSCKCVPIRPKTHNICLECSSLIEESRKPQKLVFW